LEKSTLNLLGEPASGRRIRAAMLSVVIGFGTWSAVAMQDHEKQTAEPPPVSRETLRVLKLSEHETNHGHRNAALEIEMVEDFARSNGLDLIWVETFRPTELYERLIAGEGDLIVGALPPDLADAPAIEATEAIDAQRYRAIGRLDADLRNPLDLDQLRVAVRWSSPLWPYLERLKQRLPGLHLEALPNNLEREQIFRLVADGHYDVTILATRGTGDMLSDFPRLKFLFDVTDVEPVTWYFRQDDPVLGAAVNGFIRRFQTAYPEPHAELRDLAAIKARGVLRIVTRPDARNYLVKNGRPKGFEYEFVENFARRHGLRIEVLIGRDEEEMLDWVQRGIGDVITTRIDSDLIRGEPGLVMSRMYHYSAPTIITTSATQYTSPTELSGQTVAVYPNTVHQHKLERMVQDGRDINIVLADPNEGLEEFLDRVVHREVDAALVDGHVVDDVLQMRPELAANFSLGQRYFYRWTVRGQDRDLLATIDEFLRDEYKSEIYNVLTRRYFRATRYAKLDELEYISPFDPLVRAYADRYGFDWRLIAAQMFQESQFDPNAISPVGAAGLMQIMPETAADLGFSDISDPEEGIHAGVKYLHQLRDRFDKEIPMRERTWFALAAYNVGFDRVERARRAAAKLDLDPNKWFGNVETVMRGRAKDDTGISLACRCGQTVVYVSSIRSLYSTYLSLQPPVKVGGARRRPSPPPV
jgi:membrane-bound lytic murein transglycosylase F